ncbi:unnamed protein product [Linum trigynum]|uniref:Uncharacterized protein n=1 Tax=Linum trigynum TaxID=586398 RepID=A0AAV2CV57_9ROSI
MLRILDSLRRTKPPTTTVTASPPPSPTEDITIVLLAAVEEEYDEATTMTPTAKVTTMAPAITNIITITEQPTLNGKALSSAEMMAPSSVAIIVVLNTVLPPPPITIVVDTKITMSSVESVSSCAEEDKSYLKVGDTSQVNF